MIWVCYLKFDNLMFQMTIIGIKYLVCDYDQIRRNFGVIYSCRKWKQKYTCTLLAIRARYTSRSVPTPSMGIYWEFCDFKYCFFLLPENVTITYIGIEQRKTLITNILNFTVFKNNSKIHCILKTFKKYAFFIIYQFIDI